MKGIQTFSIVLLLIHCTFSLSVKQNHDGSPYEHQFCWKDSYGRGVGTIPTDCGSNQDKIGLLCYTKCPSGYSRFGFDCHQNCPSDFNNQGLFCRKSEYGRGGGYPWKFGDSFNNNGMLSRCNKANPATGCQMSGLIAYPKCKQGYNSFGCCICRPPVPNCVALGMNGGVDLSCAKKITIGDPKSMNCPAGKQYDAGLCYVSCKSGFYGVGPVCWGNTPASWVGCGMGAAKDSKTCGQIIFDQVSSVGELALNVATLGSSSGATAAANSAQTAAKLSSLRKKFADLQKAYKATEKFRDIKDKLSTAKDVYVSAKDLDTISSADASTVTNEDIVRMSAQIAALADPTGIAGTISAYTYSKCSALKL